MTTTEMRKLRVIQNCYLPQQLAGCTFEPYLNSHNPGSGERYLFFESDVMARLISEGWHQGSECFGVLGHRWQSKLRETQALPLPLKNLNRQAITPQSLEWFIGAHPEVNLFSLACHVPHAVFQLGERIHPGLMAATERILACIGISFNLSATIQKPIYFNSFIARSDFIGRYVEDVLEPAIQAASEDRTLRTMLFADAGYFRPFPEELATFYGISHYPLHAFVGERLINVYVMLTAARVRPLWGRNPGRLHGRAAEALELQARLMQWKLAPLERRLKALQPLKAPGGHG